MKYQKAVAGVVALLLASSSVESTQAVHLQSASQHRHKHHHHHHNHFYPGRKHYIELDSKERQLQNMYSRSEEQQLARQQGILDKVKAKIEKEEQEKEQIRLAKVARDMQEKAAMEAEVIAKHKILRNEMHKKEALAQADVLIAQIKKGNINAQQLSQIMVGNVGMPIQTEEDAPQQIFAPSFPVVAEPPAVEDTVQHVQVPPAPTPVIAPPSPIVQPAPPKPELKPEIKAAEVKPIIKPAVEVKAAPAEVKKVSVPKAPEFVAPKPQPKKETVVPMQVAAEVIQPARNEDLEDSISSIAQRVLEEKRQSQAEEAEGYMQEFNEKNADLLFSGSSSRPLTMSERAEQKFKTEDGSPDALKANIDDAMDNPISHYFADKHPEVVENAQERHYLTDQV